MITGRSDATALMNSLGSQRIPFLFIIDFEMKKIRIFRIDNPLPPFVYYDFNGKFNLTANYKAPPRFYFRKYPVAFADFELAFDNLQRQIHSGNTFLANLTFPTSIETNLNLMQIFENSRARYRLLLENEFVCFSPETFVTIKEGIISTFPMKGTIQVNGNDAEKSIMKDEKEIAEHCTVVDLLRNDLSMVADHVEVKRFRFADRIRTHEGELVQISSQISGTLDENYHEKLGDILFAMLPAGSVTGAPKPKTLEIIREIEGRERGYYTGICGIFDGNDMDSAVMIRFIERCNGRLRFRSGGGITFLSDSQKEYQEIIDKVYVPITGNN